jgi:hypothetical protein
MPLAATIARDLAARASRRVKSVPRFRLTAFCGMGRLGDCPRDFAVKVEQHDALRRFGGGRVNRRP